MAGQDSYLPHAQRNRRQKSKWLAALEKATTVEAVQLQLYMCSEALWVSVLLTSTSAL